MEDTKKEHQSDASLESNPQEIEAVKQKKKRGWVAPLLGTLVAALLIGSTVYFYINPVGGVTKEYQVDASLEQAAKDALTVDFDVIIDGFNAESDMPIIAHIEGVDEDGNEVELYTVVSPNEKFTYSLPDTWKEINKISYLKSLTSDGGLYKTDSIDATATFTKVSPTDVSQNDINTVLDVLTKAIKAGDETLIGKVGTSIIDKASICAKNNPNMSDVAKEEVAEKASEEKSAAQTIQTSNSTATDYTAGTSSESTSRSTNSQSGSGATTHTHNWQPFYTTIHHDAVVQVVEHPAVTHMAYICNGCGMESPPRNHMEAVCPQTTGKPVSFSYVKIIDQAQWFENVIVQDAYDEQIVSCYMCSSCGVTKRYQIMPD